MAALDRLFFICRSKNCKERRRGKYSCTLTVPITHSSRDVLLAESLNRRKFCTLYTMDILLEHSNTPNWQLSPQRPGERNPAKLAEKAERKRKETERTGDFLEIILDE